MIVQELHRIQHDHGYLPETELRRLAERIRTPLYRLQEVASFFPHFQLQPPPRVEVRVCHDMACHQRGAAQVKAELERLLAKESQIKSLAVRYVSCLGRCDRPVAALINDEIYAARSAQELAQIAKQTLDGNPQSPDSDTAYAVHTNRPWKIDIYNGEPTYQAVRQFLEHRDELRILEALKAADLRGMGGAGVPAHQKWNDVWKAKGTEKYIVCNADESEPATFKDRELLLRTPHLVLEGVILAGLLTGATRGYIYVRHEYPEQIAAMKQAIAKAEQMGCCGQSILGTNRNFPVEVFTSPGGYVCGEQSALIEAMEDRRAQPRNKPPELQTNGLYDKPTLVSNVETFAWAPAIIVRGGEWYANQGIPDCKGLRFFSLCGDVARPGVYEVASGITLRELVEKHAGGVVGKLKAFAASGPSAGFLPALIPVEQLARGWQDKKELAELAKKTVQGGKYVNVLDLPLDLQRFRDLGLAIGAGMAIYNDTHDMADQALNCVEFFRNESCGKCVPCRIGSEKVVEIAESLLARQFDAPQLASQKQLIKELTRTMETTSICGLGMVAAKPLQTALDSFGEDVKRHLH
jgi:formate dehydrogenase beta subunit